MTAPIMITVAQKDAPKQGAKTFKITDDGGVQWYMWLDQWGHVQAGDMLRVESYKTKPFQGNDYHYIDKYVSMNGGQPQPAAPTRITSSARPHNPAPMRPPVAPPAPYVPPPPQNKDKHIYVCGVVNNLLSNPNFIVESITDQWLIEMTQIAMRAYDQTLGRKMITTGADFREEIGDEIPSFEKAPF
jgi:hypothetical protein